MDTSGITSDMVPTVRESRGKIRGSRKVRELEKYQGAKVNKDAEKN